MLVFLVFVFSQFSPLGEEGRRVVEEGAVSQRDLLVEDHKVLGALFVEVGVEEALHMQEEVLHMQEVPLQELLLSNHSPLLVWSQAASLVHYSHRYNL